MRLTNRLVLTTGVNKISLSHEDFSVGNSKTPIAILPAGTQLVEASIEVKTPFKSGNFQNQISQDSCISPLLLLGDHDDPEKYLVNEYVNETGFKLDHINSGAYFEDPATTPIDDTIILESWISPNVWTIGGDVINARYGLAGCGSQSAGLCFGGYQTAGGPGAVAYTEEYNGSSWSAGGALGTAAYWVAGCGTQTAGLKNGGAGSTNCEEYNGTAWGAGGASSISYREHAAFGLQDAAICCGGNASTNTNKSESYNGSAWSAGTDLNVGREWLFGTGLQSDGLIGNGRQYDDTANIFYSTESFNGSVFQISASTNYLASRGRAFGLASNAVRNYLILEHEEFDGISWRVVNASNISQNYNGTGGSQSAGFAASGYVGGIQTTYTENYDPADMSQSSMGGNLILNLTVI